MKKKKVYKKACSNQRCKTCTYFQGKPLLQAAKRQIIPKQMMTWLKADLRIFWLIKRLLFLSCFWGLFGVVSECWQTTLSQISLQAVTATALPKSTFRYAAKVVLVQLFHVMVKHITTGMKMSRGSCCYATISFFSFSLFFKYFFSDNILCVLLVQSYTYNSWGWKQPVCWSKTVPKMWV